MTKIRLLAMYLVWGVVDVLAWTSGLLSAYGMVLGELWWAAITSFVFVCVLRDIIDRGISTERKVHHE